MEEMLPFPNVIYLIPEIAQLLNEYAQGVIDDDALEYGVREFMDVFNGTTGGQYLRFMRYMLSLLEEEKKEESKQL